MDAKKLFLLSYEEVEENKNGVKRDSLPEPWDESGLPSSEIHHL
jgi:hypothetical protein